jgi:hypothetical protein
LIVKDEQAKKIASVMMESLDIMARPEERRIPTD